MNRSFWLLAVATCFAVAADSLFALGLAWVLAAQDRAALLGTLLTVAAATRLLLMPLGGTLADRHPKLQLLKISAFGRAVAMLLVVWGLWGDREWVAVLAMLLSGVAAAAHYPADRAAVVELVPESSLARANGILQSVMSTGAVLGPALAGVLLVTMGGRLTLVGAAVAYLLGLLTLFGIEGRAAAREAPEDTGVWADTVAGIKYAMANRSLFVLLAAIALINLAFVGPFTVGLPFHVANTLNAGPGTLAAMEVCFAAGAIGGALAVSTVLTAPSWWSIPGAVAVVGGGLGLTGMVDHAAAGMVGMVVAGVASGVANVVLVTAIQRQTEAQFVGRIMSLVTILTLGLSPVSLAITGVLVPVVGSASLLLGAAALLILGGALVAPTARHALPGKPRGVEPEADTS